MRVRLGVLDQSPVISGHSPAGAIAETVSLARLAEELTASLARFKLAA